MRHVGQPETWNGGGTWGVGGESLLSKCKVKKFVHPAVKHRLTVHMSGIIMNH